MKHTKQEFEALRNLIMTHSYFPANTMEGMEKQLDEILDNIDPYCEDY
jgi:septation ring formation regulator EzrA